MTAPRLTRAGALLLALSLPGPAWAQDDDPRPRARPEAPRSDDVPLPDPEPDDEDLMRYPPTSVRYGLVTGGIGVFGIAYGFSAMSASLWPEVPGADFLYVPVAGPFIALTQSGCAADDPDCSVIVYVRGVLYVLDVLAQMGGLGLVGEGLFMTTEADAAPDATSITILPHASPNTLGAAAIGTF